jgi:organic hydroperoxide reductase OsmC/OhrA
VVPLPLSDASAVDPEEMFVASLASCHMLWFLSLAAQRGFKVDRYEDDAEGWLARNAQGPPGDDRGGACAPQVQWLGDASARRRPAAGRLHHDAHEPASLRNRCTPTCGCEPRL